MSYVYLEDGKYCCRFTYKRIHIDVPDKNIHITHNYYRLILQVGINCKSYILELIKDRSPLGKMFCSVFAVAKKKFG